MFYRKLFNKFTLKYVTNIPIKKYNNGPRYIREKITSDDVLLRVIENNDIKSNKDWKMVREQILNYEYNRDIITPVNIDSFIIGYCTKPDKYHLALSYYKFLNEEKIKPNLATMGKYIKFLYEKNQEKCSKAEEAEILSIYKQIRESYPVLDSFTLENLVLGLSITKEWRKCLDFLNEIKISATPNNSSYSALISSAFINGEEDLAWEILNEMLDNNRRPKSIIYISYLRSIKKLKTKKAIHSQMEKLFEFLKEYDIRLEKPVVSVLMELAEKLKISIADITVDTRGACRNCDQKLETFELTDEEFLDLKNRLFKNVILGRDIFVKTSPQEMSRFQDFISQQENFDVVLDGLNIAYSIGVKQSPHVFSTLVANVVKHFVQQNKKVLVLGRVHMNRWPAQTWGYVKQSATLFLTQNISEDDPYLLYCALNSGKNTIIVTRDLMRGHRFLLKSPKYKTLFNRWLIQRQYQLLRMDQRGKPMFKHPLPFSPNAQKNGTYWHLPFDHKDNPKNEYLNSWCCVQLGK